MAATVLLAETVPKHSRSIEEGTLCGFRRCFSHRVSPWEQSGRWPCVNVPCALSSAPSPEPQPCNQMWEVWVIDGLSHPFHSPGPSLPLVYLLTLTLFNPRMESFPGWVSVPTSFSLNSLWHEIARLPMACSPDDSIRTPSGLLWEFINGKWGRRPKFLKMQNRTCPRMLETVPAPLL